MPDTTICPIDGCTANLKSGHLMCLAHWRMVPLKLQRAVNTTWRNVRSDPHAYRDARAAALRVVNDEASPGGLFGG